MNLFLKIKNLRHTIIKDKINERLLELENNGKNNKNIFSELCFCLLTANFQAKKSWEIQKKYSDLFEKADEKTLKEILKKEGHRFWEQRAKRIILAREKKDELFKNIKEKKENIRDWIVENFIGIGMKEASHFLRNIGFFNYAIIDFHIIDLLVKEEIILRPKTITKKRYIEIENELKKIAKKINMNLGELDLYMWYLETNTILK